MARVLIVDDEKTVCEVISLQLREEGYQVEVAYNGKEGLEKVASFEPDVVVTDVLMPQVNGIDMCRQIKTNPQTQFLPVIVMTTVTDRARRMEAIEAGADEFLNKPVDSVEMFTRLKVLVRVKQLINELEYSKNIIEMLAHAIEAKDGYTERHLERVKKYSLALAKKCQVPAAMLKTIEMGAVLHDVGKIGIPESILKKPASLTPEEYEIIKTHPEIGVKICEPLKFLKEVLKVIECHHERMDGKGYPHRLKGEEIPLEARIVSIADAFDALTSDRPYRKGVSLQQAIAILKEGQGTQWDAHLVDQFIQMLQEK